MKPAIESLECLPGGDLPVMKVTVVYEDFACGVRAKMFTDRLAKKLGRASMLSDSFWRTDLLACPPIAAKASRAADHCDYLIVAVRGDCILPISTCQWIEAQLDQAAGRDLALIVLPDSERGKPRVLEATRHHFRNVCAMKGIAFFSHALSPVDRTAREGGKPALPMQRWTPDGNLSLNQTNQNDRRHDLTHNN